MTQISVHRPNRPARPARWGGFSDFFEDFLHDRAAHSEPRTVRSRGVYPPVNLHETPDEFVLTAELPGVAPEDIDVSLEGKTVTLSGQRKIEYAAGDGTAVHRRERQSGHFRRAIELPSPFDVEGTKAKHRVGVLELHLPKTPDSKPRQVEIQTS
jgi:HSP20 family protein